MKKGWIITIAIIILLAIGIFTAIYINQRNQTEDSNVTQNKQLAQKGEIEQNQENQNKIISTSITEEKISPNSVIIEKQYFKGCDHLIRKQKDIPEELINSTQQELERNYPDWSIEKFSANEVVIYQEKDGFCHQHYLIKEHNGVLGIYTINENGEQTLKKDTEIEVQYLPEEDLIKVREGIEAIGDNELHTVLEDFE